MRLHRFLFFLILVSVAAAQTYKPKQIRIEGADRLDKTEILRTLGLSSGVPLTKIEIEAALQKLADTGAYADVSYTVNDAALTITLKPAEGAEAMPIRFANFVWWQSAELEALLEQKLPLYKGKLPLSGALTNQVITVLQGLMAEKGVADAKITATPSSSEGGGTGVSSIALTITSPSIVLGDLKILGAAPEVRAQLDVVSSKFAGRDFDSTESSVAIQNDVTNTHKNAGYLDAVIDAPEYSAPHKDMLSYEVDASVLAHPGAFYRVGSLDLDTPPPVTKDEAATATGLRIGQAAGAADLQIATNKLMHAYTTHGFLEVHIQPVVDRNASSHTVAYRFSIDPGSLDHVTSVNASALPADQQQTFASQFQGKSGAPADSAFVTEMFRVLKAMNAESSIHITQRLNRQTHTVEMLLVPANHP